MGINEKSRARRSLLFVPGLRPDMFTKALSQPADIVCIDLEDAVAIHRKDESRDLTMELFSKNMKQQRRLWFESTPLRPDMD